MSDGASGTAGDRPQVGRDFRKLTVWKRAHVLALGVYQATSAFPREETYGLGSQMRRAAVSIPANIAEGCGRKGDAEFGRFLQMAMGSASELEYHVLLAKDLGLIESQGYQDLSGGVADVKRMLTSFLRQLRVGS